MAVMVRVHLAGLEQEKTSRLTASPPGHLHRAQGENIFIVHVVVGEAAAEFLLMEPGSTLMSIVDKDMEVEAVATWLPPLRLVGTLLCSHHYLHLHVVRVFPLVRPS